METSIQSTTSIDVSNQDKANYSENERMETKPVENTPFTLVGSKEKGYFIGMGKYRLTDPKESEIEALLELEHKKYNIIANMVTIMLEQMQLINTLSK